MVFFSLYVLIFVIIVSSQSFYTSKINSTTPIDFYKNNQIQQNVYNFYFIGIFGGLCLIFLVTCIYYCAELKFKKRSHKTQSGQINIDGLSSLQLEIPVYSVQTNENRNRDLPSYDEISIGIKFDKLPSYSSFRETKI